MIYYVNAQVGRGGNGSKETPFKRIGDAAKIAVPGDEVIVAPGVYREYVDPQNAGTEDARTLTAVRFRSARLSPVRRRSRTGSLPGECLGLPREQYDFRRL